MTIESRNKHSEICIRGIEELKKNIDTLDDWKVSKKSGDLTIYNKPTSDSTLPAIVRGDITFTPPPGATPRQILGAAAFSGCRLHWDSRFDSYKVHDIYSDSELLGWCKLKAPWPVSPRDLCFILYKEHTETESYCALLSVVDEAVPEVSGCVRAKLMSGGWKIYQESPTKMGISFVNQTDLAGSLPTSLVNKLATEIPSAVKSVVDYVNQFGFPPCSIVEGDVETKHEDFTHKTSSYVFQVVGKGGSIKSTVSGRMYPNGFSARLEGDGEMIQGQKDKNGNTCIQFNSLQGPVKLIIEKK